MNLFNTLLTPTNGIKLWCHWSMAGPLNKHAPIIRRLLFNSLWEIWRWRNKCCNILLLRPSVGIDVNASAERRGRWRGESHCIFLFAARAFWFFFSHSAHCRSYFLLLHSHCLQYWPWCSSCLLFYSCCLPFYAHHLLFCALNLLWITYYCLSIIDEKAWWLNLPTTGF